MNLSDLIKLGENQYMDFKREPYDLTNKAKKAEIIKDILSFSNYKSRQVGYILLGIAENRNGKHEILGINNTYDDSELQQIVNSKTNKTINFSFSLCEIENKNIGVIEISKDQNRPLFLKKDFEHVKKNIVYCRESTTTKIATPDEIIELSIQKPNVLLKLAEFVNAKNKKSPGNQTLYEIMHSVGEFSFGLSTTNNVPIIIHELSLYTSLKSSLILKPNELFKESILTGTKLGFKYNEQFHLSKNEWKTGCIGYEIEDKALKEKKITDFFVGLKISYSFEYDQIHIQDGIIKFIIPSYYQGTDRYFKIPPKGLLSPIGDLAQRSVVALKTDNEGQEATVISVYKDGSQERNEIDF